MPRADSLRMRIRIGLTMLLAAALLAPSARADRRTMIRAYEYMTQPQGNLELELWNDVSAPVAGGFDQASTLQRIELEYGLTDHWDLALYHVFGQDPGASLRFDSWRLETRYRLFEKNVLPVDVMLYFEVERPADFKQPFEAEEKLIVARVSTEVSVAFPAISATAAGYDVYAAIDASATFSETKRTTGILRMVQAGVIVTDYASIAVEMLNDNADPKAAQLYAALDLPYAALVGQLSAALARPAA